MTVLYCTFIDIPSFGEVRLYYDYSNASYQYGRVEVFMEKKWGTVANDGSWTIEDGEVVCRELGFEIPSKFHEQICLPAQKIVSPPHYIATNNHFMSYTLILLSLIIRKYR